MVPRDDDSLPALLRHARGAYASAMRAALGKAGYGDIPKNGLYLLGGLSSQKRGRPLGQLIEELRLSKQAAGQLVDALVLRGYLQRAQDQGDRRKWNITLTERGRTAAKVQARAVSLVNAELTSRVGPKEVERTRRTLVVLAELQREQDAGVWQ